MMTELRLNVAAVLVNVNETHTLAEKKKDSDFYKQNPLKVESFRKVSYNKMSSWWKSFGDGR